MPTHADRLLRYVRRIASPSDPESNDSGLLARYLTDGDSAAFAALVSRHGPMVLRVCQHVLGNRHDAEDAFQATFLILARKAGGVRPTGCLAGWLHSVASRVALRARAATRRRGAALTPDGAPADSRPDPLAELTARETLRILEEEVQRLPAAYRLPVTLCCLHGLTQEEAARQLGWTPGSVKGRLERGRKRLQRRLTGRGLGLAAALALVEVARATAAGPGEELVASTALAAVAVASGNTAGSGLVSSEVLSLARRGLTSVALAKGKLGLLLLLVGTLAAGLAALGHQLPAERPPGVESPKPKDPEQLTNAEFPKGKQPRLDVHGDPLPDGAIARLGTVRMRHAHPISGAVFSRDGKSIIASDFYSGVHVWDVAEGKEVRRFFRDDYYCHGLALSPDGRTLAVALGGSDVRLCDPRSGRELGPLPIPKDPIDSVSQLVFSPDGSLLATGTGRGSIRIWEVATRRLVRKVTFAANVGKVAFSSDGKLLACGTWDGHCRLWDLAQGKELRRLRNEPDGNYSLYTIFAPNGGPLAVWGYGDRSIRLFDADGSKEIRRFKAEGAEKMGPPNLWGWVNSIYASFSPDGKILAVFRDVGRIELWEVESGKKLYTLACGRSHKPSFLSFSPDGTKLASAGGDLWAGDHIVRVWDVTRGKEILPLTGHSSPISSAALSPNGNTVATAGQDGVIHLWERSSAKHLFRLEGDLGRRRQVSISSDGQRVASWETYRGGALRIWDTKTGQSVSRLETQSADAFWTVVSCNGNTALSFDEKEKASRFRNLDTGKVTREFDNAVSYPIALSPAGDKMVCSDGILRSAVDRKELFQIGTIGTRNLSVRFSADGRRLAAAVTAKDDNPGKYFLSGEPSAEEITVIDPIGGKELRRFGKKIGTAFYLIDAAVLSSDGKMVVTSFLEGNKYDGQAIITLWETETGRERGHFLGRRGQTRSLAISADGRFIVSGADDTSALVWDATRPRTRTSSLPRESAATDVAARFKDLARENAEHAYASQWALINTPKQTVSFLADQGSLFARADVQMIQRWIQDLDSDKFAERERASQELGLILDEAEPRLKKALQSRPSLEVRRRIDLLLGRRSIGPSGKELQRFRVIEILEHIAAGDADATRLTAIALLKKLAVGAPGARPTQEAKASLERLANRPITP
jgi:RNA polymerase sigma factor (sigma-70 family)